MATSKEIAQIIRVLVAAYPNAKLVPSGAGVPGTVEVYATMLADLDAETLLAAVKYCIRTHPSFIPSVADIHAAAMKIREADTATISGQDAWRIALREVDRCGLVAYDIGGHAPHFDDPAIAQAVAAIGWRELCLANENDPSTRHQFIAAYEAYARRRADRAHLDSIPEAARVIARLADRLALQGKGGA